MALTERSAERPRIVYIDHVAQLSGGELALLRLLRDMHAIDAHVILAEDGPLVGRLQEMGVSVEVLELPVRTRLIRKDRVRPSGIPVTAALDTARYSFSLSRRLRTIKPAAVHTNSLKAGVYGSVAARLAGVPMVWHLRDRLSNDYLPATAVWLVRRMLSRAGVVICNSESTRETLGFERPTFVVPSPIDIQRSSRDRLRVGGPQSPFVVGMVGRLAPWKGQDIFLRAFAEAFPDGSEQAVIVGGALFGHDEREYSRSLEALAVDLGIGSRVTFRGHQENVQGELDGMDVLVHASRIAEPLGQVVLEGMAAGLPIIAAAAGGPAMIVRHEETGLLFEPANERDLAKQLLRVAGDRELREALIEGALAGTAPYRAEAIIPQILEAYAAAGVRVR